MAKRTKHKSRALSVYRPSAPKPIVIRTTKVMKPRHHRRGRHGGGGRGLMNKERIGIIAGSFVVGLIEKQGFMANLPKLPIIGAIGTIGIAAYLISDGGKNKLANEVCTAALTIAAHDLATTGAIIGEGGGVGRGVDYVAGW